MSNEINKNNIPTNQEIVQELTKDLESQFTISDKENTSENVIDVVDNKSSSGISNERVLEFDDNSEKSESSEENVETKPEIPDDFVDELALKDIELQLTEEEREERRKKAIELKGRGNEEYKSEKYLESIKTYTEGLKTCPLKYESDRAVLYANRAASKMLINRKETALDDCARAIELNPGYVRAYLRRAKLYEESDKLDESLADYTKILQLDPGNREALSASTRLPPKIEERNEKLKTEMLGKLKDLGNMILKPFGLSTENFQLQKDSNSGGYSVNFQQAAKK